MYPFNAFYVTYGGNYKRYPSVFDLRAYSTGVSVTMSIDVYDMCTFGHFSHVFTGESVDYFTFTYTFL